MASPSVVLRIRTCVILCVCTLALLVNGCTHNDVEPPAPPPVAAPVVVQATTEKSIGQVTIYRRAKGTAGPADDPLSGLVAVTIPIPVDAHSPARAALEYLISYKDSPLPRGTKLLGVSVDDTTSIATVNFSKQVTNGVDGETKAQMVVNSILATMGQFANVKQVQLEVDGKTDCEFGGAISCSDVLPVISPNSAVAQKGREGIDLLASRESPIGVFDSGLGGLSVASSFLNFTPYESLL